VEFWLGDWTGCDLEEEQTEGKYLAFVYVDELLLLD
jgi:hypothetical protein